MVRYGTPLVSAGQSEPIPLSGATDGVIHNSALSGTGSFLHKEFKNIIFHSQKVSLVGLLRAVSKSD